MKTKAEIEKAETGKPGRNFCFPNFCFLLFQPATAQRRKTVAPLTALTIIFDLSKFGPLS
jgi:hypothetical protein